MLLPLLVMDGAAGAGAQCDDRGFIITIDLKTCLK